MTEVTCSQSCTVTLIQLALGESCLPCVILEHRQNPGVERIQQCVDVTLDKLQKAWGNTVLEVYIGQKKWALCHTAGAGDVPRRISEQHRLEAHDLTQPGCQQCPGALLFLACGQRIQNSTQNC